MLTEEARKRLERTVYHLPGTIDGIVLSEATREQLLEIVDGFLQEKAYDRRLAEHEREMLTP